MSEIVTNHKARRDYAILDTYEAGIVLHGTEVKSLRAGQGQIADAFAKVEKDAVWLGVTSNMPALLAQPLSPLSNPLLNDSSLLICFSFFVQLR